MPTSADVERAVPRYQSFYGITLGGRPAQALAGAYRAYVATSAARLDRPEAHRRAATRLAVLIQAGRDQGWPWRTMADVCGVSSQRISQVVGLWGGRSDGAQVKVPKFPSYAARLEAARAERAASRPPPVRGHLTDEERDELAELGAIAAQNSGGVPIDDPRRNASERFSALIAEYRQRKVTWREMADATGKTVGALRARSGRHGHGSVPPSQSAYQGVQTLPPPNRGGANNGQSKVPGG